MFKTSFLQNQFGNLIIILWFWKEFNETIELGGKIQLRDKLGMKQHIMLSCKQIKSQVSNPIKDLQWNLEIST